MLFVPSLVTACGSYPILLWIAACLCAASAGSGSLASRLFAPLPFTELSLTRCSNSSRSVFFRSTRVGFNRRIISILNAVVNALPPFLLPRTLSFDKVCSRYTRDCQLNPFGFEKTGKIKVLQIVISLAAINYWFHTSYSGRGLHGSKHGI